MSALAVCLSLVSMLIAGIGAGQGQPEVSIAATEAAVGDTVTVSGRGWPANELVILVVCGNSALNGSADCAESDYALRPADARGGFTVDVTLSTPPAPCPCVIKASTLALPAPVLTPIELIGVAHAIPTGRSPLAEDASTHIEVVDERIIQDGDVLDWFGWPSQRTLLLTVRNTGSTTVTEAWINARWGKGTAPTKIVPALTAGELRPGAETVIEVPVRLDALAIGQYQVTGDIGTIGGRTEFRAVTSQWPVGLFAVAAAAVHALLLTVRNRIRRRIDRARSNDLTPDVPGGLVDLRPSSFPAPSAAAWAYAIAPDDDVRLLVETSDRTLAASSTEHGRQ